MRYHLLFILVWVSVPCFAQVLNDDKSTPSGKQPHKYAVVVGISDYQDEGIPDLRFADKDAEAFANFLRSPAGGSLDEDHLKLLTNSQATTGQLVAAMDWLVDACKEGDQAIIYFSGHGDVESKSAFNLGFLLTWDSPSKAYMAGAYPLFYLQAMVSTLSTENKIKVVLITDACRSGKLAGNDVAGNQLTNANLAKQFANEIKILSCQPSEYSIEGEQWGGGRGAFSYHLIDGLYGMADKNGDQAISLSEMDRYLEDHVTPEVAPQSQIPMTIGNRAEKLTTVFPELLAQVEKSRQGQLPSFKAIASKGMEDDVLATLDEAGRELYQRFKTALSEQNFLSDQLSETQVACADAHYAKLIKEPKLERLHATMRRNYAAALQDEAQQVLNKILNNDVVEMSLSKFRQNEKYNLYPGYLQRASKLLGEDHYMYPVLQARKFYFEGYLLHHLNETSDQELGEKALDKYRAALALQPDFPHPYHSMAEVHFWQMLQPDSAEHYAGRAVELAPTWFVPYSALATMFARTLQTKYYDKIKDYLERADQVDSLASRTNAWHMQQWGNYYLKTDQYAEAEQQFKKVIALDSSFARAYNRLGTVYMQSSRHKEAEEQLMKSMALDSTDDYTFANLGILYTNLSRYMEAETYLKKALQIDSTSLIILNALAGVYNSLGRHIKADSLFERAFQMDSTTILNYWNAGYGYRRAGRYEKAEEIFLRGLQVDSNNVNLLIGLAGVYFLQSSFEKSEKIVLRGLQVDSNKVDLLRILALLYCDKGRYEKAEEIYFRILEVDSNNITVREALSQLYLITNRLGEAEQLILEMINSDYPPIFANSRLGLVYAKMGRYEEADQLFQKDLEVYPEYKKYIIYYYAVMYGLQNQIDKAYESLDQALGMGYEETLRFKFIEEPALSAFAPLRAQKERWEALMEKYFPGQSKD